MVSSLLDVDQADLLRAQAQLGADGFLDPERWQRLAGAVNPREFAIDWLALQCALVPNVDHALVLLRDADREAFTPVAVRPATSGVPASLRSVGEAAVREGRGIVRRVDEGTPNRWQIAYPVSIEGVVHAVVAVQVERKTRAELPPVMRALQWGSTWLESFIRRQVLPTSTRLASVVQLTAIALERERFKAAATAVATELATTHASERVSVGIRQGMEIHVHALSHSAEFGEKSNLMRLLGAAMEEAADQEGVLSYPANDPQSRFILHAHSVLAKQGCRYICTIPLVDGEAIVGAITLERNDKPYLRESIQQLEHAATIVGPILHAKWREDRWIGAKVAESASRFGERLSGKGNIATKLAALAATFALLVAVFIDAPYRLTATATLQGSIQRAVTAPIAGYITDAHVRAGDIVEQGQLLATLDERDLQLERLRWISERERFRREYSRALAEGERSSVQVLSAQVEQADAQVRLFEEQLARVRIEAPFQGVVVSGDLSQSLSAPVERGQVLFEIAPLDSYRVVLKVDERDIAELVAGQSGELALAGMPQTPLEFVVSRVTPVAIAENGRNYFEAEAQLLSAHESLRPGMEGVAKVSVDDRRIGWIYTHRFTHWLRTRLWQILP